ncbi:MAG: histidine-type phosphatase [Candidatus Eremiobacteraeota bacterium]|nr:histidine-type phosphatase [Candidatus Eremiobacteraeota bacterium]
MSGLFAALVLLSGSLLLDVRPALGAGELRMVVVVSRHGVRSPTHPDELAAYARQPWPKWSGTPGDLTARGASLMQQFGAAYRQRYGPALGLGTSGCPPAGSVFIWADVDQRTKATGKAVAQGFAPGCNIAVGYAPKDPDTLFDPLPGVGTVDKAESTAAVMAAAGGNLNTLTQENASTFALMERVLGCTGPSSCKKISSDPTTVDNSGDGGLASLNGGLDEAGDVAENLLLEYTDGHADVGWGRVDHTTLVQLLKLHELGKEIEHNRYAARAHSSNIMVHAVLQTLQEGATDRPVAGTRVPAQSRFVFFSGHDTQLAEFAGLLRISWQIPGDARNDTPPGSAVIFELHKRPGGADFVRTFFTAQSLDAMRAGNGEDPLRVPIHIPGCPSLDCPFATFNRVVNSAIDPKFVMATWK